MTNSPNVNDYNIGPSPTYTKMYFGHSPRRSSTIYIHLRREGLTRRLLNGTGPLIVHFL